MAGKMVNQSLVLLTRFGNGGQKRTSETATSHIRKTLPASLKNEQSTNDRHNETENNDRKSEHSDSRPKSQRFCIFIFSQCTFFKNNFSQPHKWHIWLCPPHRENPSQSQKSHFFFANTL